MDELKELRESVEARQEQQANQRVREYHEIMDSKVALLEQELAGINRVGVAVLPAALKILEKYTPSQSDPPALAKAIADLRNVCIGAIDTCKQNPGKLESLIEKINGRTENDCRLWGVNTLAREDSREVAVLLGRAKALEALPREIERLEKPVLDLVGVWAPREKQGQGHQLPVPPRGALNRQSEDEVHIKTDFEVR